MNKELMSLLLKLDSIWGVDFGVRGCRKILRPVSPVVVDNENEGIEVTGNENKILTREVSLIRERLRVIESDSGLLKHAAITLQRGEEGAKLSTEIAQLLRRLRPPIDISPSGDYQIDS